MCICDLPDKHALIPWAGPAGLWHTYQENPSFPCANITKQPADYAKETLLGEHNQKLIPQKSIDGIANHKTIHM